MTFHCYISDIDECNQGHNPCMWPDDPNVFIDEAIRCENSFGGHKCYSNISGSVCENFANNSGYCTIPFPISLSPTSRIKTTLLGNSYTLQIKY